MGELLRNNKRILIYLLSSNLLLFFGFQIWQTMFNNFAVEEMGVGPASIGLIQALREVPGLMGFLLGVIALFLSEVRIMALSVTLLGAGMIMTGRADSLTVLLVATVAMSFGFHFYYPSSNAVVLMVAKEEDTPKTLGLLGSLSAISSVAATGVVFFLARPLGYRTLFIAIGGLVACGGLLLLIFGRNAGDALPTRRQIVLRKRYWLYYALAFLSGSRRHVLSTFAIFLLVRNYGISVQTTALLFLVNSLINIYALRLIGQLVSRLGERVVLSVAAATLVFIFLGYAYVSYLPVLFGLFVIDNLLFGFNMAITTYFQKIAVSPEEITSNLSVEQAINHITAVIIPIVGGTAWEMFGSQVPFLAGVVIVTMSFILAQFIQTIPRPAVVVSPVGG